MRIASFSSLTLLSASLVLAACSQPVGWDDASTDTGRDSGTDARTDAGNDTGPRDTGTDTARDAASDNGPDDTGVIDSGPEDTGVIDSGLTDTGPLDGGADATDAIADVPSDTRADAIVTDGGADVFTTDSMCALHIRGSLTLPAPGTSAVVASGDLNATGFQSQIATLPMCPTTNQMTAGEDYIYTLDITTPTTLTITSAGLQYVPFLALRTACADAATQLECQGRNGPDQSRNAQIMRTLDPGHYYVIIDRLTSLEDSFTLTIAVQ